MGNYVIHPDRDGYAARTYVDAIVMRGDNRTGFQMLGYYDDDYRLTDDGWRISRRNFTPTVTMQIVSYPHED
jgi:hypothetical protein